MYINIEMSDNDEDVPTKISREVNTESTNSMSDVLENVSESVVRNFKNIYK